MFIIWILPSDSLKLTLPIPGTKRISYLEENIGSLDVELSSEDLRQIDEVMPPTSVSGDRY
ncbi:aldo/keto reductase [Paenibacillus sp. FSL R7-0216]|uniref:aldo/keto reductase n=1 Tax=Paenibacillus sp. FSL R7-0216 TaxID=2921677 RepID=UPI0030DCF784